MNSGDILRDVMIAGGGILLVMTIFSLARRHLTEIFCLVWGFFAVLMILGGILLRPTGIGNYISDTGLILAVLLGGLVILAAYFISMYISMLERQNRELAMQVALLNEEQERLWGKFHAQKDDEKNTFCD